MLIFLLASADALAIAPPALIAPWTDMRKTPRQARARQTVEFILDAAAYILAERGLAGFTTNHVAERAGVNIASLYQYFPNKTAILEALQNRHVGKPDHVPPAWLDGLRDAPLEDVLRLLVDAALDEHAENPAMHRTLLMTLPRDARSTPAGERLAQVTALLSPKSRTGANPEMMMFVARHALLGVIDEALCERPQWLRDDSFRTELVQLLHVYLRPAEPPACVSRP